MLKGESLLPACFQLACATPHSFRSGVLWISAGHKRRSIPKARNLQVRAILGSLCNNVGERLLLLLCMFE